MDEPPLPSREPSPPTSAGWGAPDGAGPSTDPPGRRLSGTGWLVLGVVFGMLALAAGAVVLVQVLRQPDEGGWAEAWDPRLTELVAFVEDERDLDFEHPVEVVFLPDAEFRAEVTDDGTGPTDEERLELDRLAAQFRALGLVTGEVDLFEAGDQLAGEGVLGLYSPEDRRIVVRGEELTPAVRATLVHELTHALQDQRYGIEAMFEAAGDDGAITARAVMEGDATLVERAYEREVDDDGGAPGDDGELTPDLEGIPPVLVVLVGAPYELGPSLLTYVEERAGRDAVAALFEEPLRSEIALFDPRRALDDRPRAEVAVPGVPDGAEVLDDGGFGAFAWYLALAARIDAAAALGIVDGWVGDAYVAYEDGDRVCVAAAFEAVDEQAVDRLVQGLEDWASQLPDGAASVEPGERGAELRSCDPGGTAEAAPTNDLVEAMVLPLVRAQLLADLAANVPSSVGDDDLWCFATTLVGDLSIEQLTSSEATSEVEAAVLEAQRGCDLVG
jgi:hypothetical protein